MCSLLLLMSCTGSDYVNVVPRESVAMAAIDFESLGVQDLESVLLVGTDSPTSSGLDMSSKMYAFETPDGTLGMVAKVDDSDAVTDMLEARGTARGTLCNDKRLMACRIY